ncbi:MAG: hypothetical protein M8364_21060 [Methylobacter sp.]|uniref:hypothetical protein n=1 Tax=Methylobacter sp. TaxID=2051955 RepID=UPI00258B2217|nr:hypothetical protein [Methylobacter sp.]MCL7423384.1 hypothetical protein [Methylobacter sp.]
MRDFAFAWRPALALAGTVAVGFLGLVVEKNLLGRERQIEAFGYQRVGNLFQNGIQGVEAFESARRLYPPA